MGPHFFVNSVGKNLLSWKSLSRLTLGGDAVLDIVTGVVIDANKIQSALQFVLVLV